jgi:hypothetical protein
VVKSIGAWVGALLLSTSSAFAQDTSRTVTAPAGTAVSTQPATIATQVPDRRLQAIPNESGRPSGTTASTQSSDGRWQAIFNEDTRYYWWQSSRGFPYGATVPAKLGVTSGVGPPPPGQIVLPDGFPAQASGGSGSLMYVPIAFQLTGLPTNDIKSEFLLRGGAANGTQTTPGMSGQVTTQIDTSVTQKFTYLGFAGFQPFASLSVNVPTGRTVLLGSSAFARMDPDLVELATYGEGWNLGPTIGVNIPLTPTLITSFGAGYTMRGPYDRESVFDPTALSQGRINIDPGDVSTVNTTIGYRNGGFVIQGSGSYSAESVTMVDRAPFTKAGDRYLASITVANSWTNMVSSTLTGMYTHSLRNKVVDPSAGGWVVEAFNSNSDLFKAVLDVTVRYNAWSVGPTGSYLFRNNNSWNSTAMEFLPAKTRYSAGGTTGYALTDAVSLNARVEHIWIKENANPDKLITEPQCPSSIGGCDPGASFIVPGSGVPVVSSTGWLVSLAATAHF